MGRRRRTGATDTYSVYDSRGRKLVGGVDREVAVRYKQGHKTKLGERDVTMIRKGQEGKEPGPRRHTFDV